jgi:hypothetical protein
MNFTPPIPDQEMQENLWDPDCEDYEGKSLGNETSNVWVRWVTLDKEQPVHQVDPQIKSAQERHRLLARECNWSALIEQMHARYLILKLHTHNWARANTYKSFPIQCSCPPHLKYSRKVDMVDIYGMCFFSLSASYISAEKGPFFLNRPKKS